MQTKLYTTIYIKVLHLSSWWQCLHCSLSFVAWPASVTSKKPKTKTDFTVYRLASPNTLNDTNLSNVRKSLLMSLFFLLPSLTQLSPFPQQTNAMCCQIMCGLLAFKSLYVFTLICFCTFFFSKTWLYIYSDVESQTCMDWFPAQVTFQMPPSDGGHLKQQSKNASLSFFISSLVTWSMN